MIKYKIRLEFGEKWVGGGFKSLFEQETVGAGRLPR